MPAPALACLTAAFVLLVVLIVFRARRNAAVRREVHAALFDFACGATDRTRLPMFTAAPPRFSEATGCWIHSFSDGDRQKLLLVRRQGRRSLQVHYHVASPDGPALRLEARIRPGTPAAGHAATLEAVAERSPPVP